jgi:hypothetical protein
MNTLLTNSDVEPRCVQVSCLEWSADRVDDCVQWWVQEQVYYQAYEPLYIQIYDQVRVPIDEHLDQQ